MGVSNGLLSAQKVEVELGIPIKESKRVLSALSPIERVLNLILHHGAAK